MALKDWIKNVSSEVSKATSKSRSTAGGSRRAQESHSLSDLIALGRVEEAEERLRARLKKKKRDHHARLNLADLLFETGRRVDAVEEYMFVAEGYAADGFSDKAHALLTKLDRLMPGEPKLTAKLSRLEKNKELGRRLKLGQESLLEAPGGPAGSNAFTIQQATAKLVECPLLEILTDEQVQRLFRRLEVFRVAEQASFVRRGQQREELLILLAGEMAAEVPLVTGGKTIIRTFGPGKVIGDAALLQRQPWPAAYSAVRRVVALKLDRAGLEELLPGEPDPRGLLDALRSQNNDLDVANAIAGMSKPAETAP